jgi:hypothetical protein
MAIILLISGLVSSGLVAWRYRQIPHFGRFDDDAVYVVCAKALAEGHGYRIESLPGAPAETKFPPLFPALIAPIWHLDSSFPGNLQLLTPWLWAMVPALCAVSFAVFQSLGFDAAWALALAGIIALNPVVAMFGVSVMSELLFTVLLLSSLCLVECAQGRWWIVAAAGAIGGLAYLDRTAALPLLATVPACLIFQRRWRAGIVYFGSMLPAVLVWSRWCSANRPRTADATLLFHTDYFGQYLRNLRWSDLPDTISTNLGGLVSSLGRLALFHTDANLAGLYGTYVVGVVVTAGMGIFLWKARFTTPQYGAFAAAYCAILLVWNFPPNERFVLPLFPLALAGVTAGVRRFGAALRLSVLGVSCIANGYALFATVPQILDADSARMAQARGAYRWVDTHTPPVATFYAYDDALFYLYTGRQAIAPHTLNKSSGLDNRRPIVGLFAGIPEWARARGLSYAVVNASDFSRDLTADESRTVIESISSRLPRLYSSPASMVLQFQLP